MKLERGKISSSQLIFLTMGYIIGVSVLIIPGGEAKNLTWLAIFIGIGEALIYAYFFLTLSLHFPGKTLVQFNDIIYGPYLGKIISIAYILYFILLGSWSLRFSSEFFVSTSFPETPISVLIILTILLCASAVRNGIEVIARCSLILVPMALFYYYFDDIALIQEYNLNKLLPLYIPLKDLLRSSHKISTMPFGETVIFLMIIPFLNNIKEAKKIKIAFIIVGITFAISSIRNTAVLGALTTISTYPTYTVIRMINIGDILTRMEAIIGLLMLTMGFIKISILYYGTVLGIAQLLNLRSYLSLVLPIGVIMVSLSILSFDSLIEMLHFNQNIYPYYSVPFQFGLPLLSLIIVKLRDLPKNN